MGDVPVTKRRLGFNQAPIPDHAWPLGIVPAPSHTHTQVVRKGATLKLRMAFPSPAEDRKAIKVGRGWRWLAVGSWWLAVGSW